MAIQLDGQPTVITPQPTVITPQPTVITPQPIAATPQPGNGPMPVWDFGSMDMMDVSAFDNPMAAIFGSHADATSVPTGTDTDAQGTGYVPRSFTEMAGAGSAPLTHPQQTPPNPAPPVAAPVPPTQVAPATPTELSAGPQPRTDPQQLRTDPQPRTDPQHASTEADPPQPDVDALRREVEELKGVKDYMASNEFQNAKIVAEQLVADPVTFIQNYMPDVVEQLGITQAVSSNVPPQDFARQYMEQKLAEKYGDEFVYNPQDAGFKNTESYNYDLDRQLLIQEGFSRYYAAQQRQAAEARDRQAQAMNAAVSQGQAYGLTPDEVRTALTALDAEKAADPVATYYEMLFAWMAAKGRITPRTAGAAPAGAVATSQTQTVVSPNTLPRRPEAVPAPSVAQTPAGSAEPLAAAVQRMAEDFPLDYIMNGSGF